MVQHKKNNKQNKYKKQLNMATAHLQATNLGQEHEW